VLRPIEALIETTGMVRLRPNGQGAVTHVRHHLRSCCLTSVQRSSLVLVPAGAGLSCGLSRGRPWHSARQPQSQAGPGSCRCPWRRGIGTGRQRSMICLETVRGLSLLRVHTHRNAGNRHCLVSWFANNTRRAARKPLCPARLAQGTSSDRPKRQRRASAAAIEAKQASAGDLVVHLLLSF